MNQKILTAILSAVLLLALTGCGAEKGRVLNIYNWGEYISDGTDGTMDVIAEFESWYEETYGEPVTVHYSTFASNEDMYNKIAAGAVSYDLLFPSDYMVARMRQEDMLLPLNFDNIPNYQYIDPGFRDLYYDPDNLYSIPYAYGIVGVIYNANAVDPRDAQGWDLLFNEKYADQILQYNNSRDAFGTAMYRLGIDVNTEDPALWQQACAELIRQRPLVKSYVMDEIYNLMQSGEAAIGSYYVGDFFLMREAQADTVDLQFYYPEATNFFVDAMCIPRGAQDQELAEIFINFLLSEEIAVANAEYIYCPVPNVLVTGNEDYRENMGPEVLSILYPEFGEFSRLYNRYAYRNLSPELLDQLNTLWETVKVS